MHWGDTETEVPCWSGLWFEIEGMGYMEISDLDGRAHRPPEGWGLVSISHNLFNSSQIYRYFPAGDIMECEQEPTGAEQ